MCPTLTVGSFFQTRKVHFFVHLFNNVKPQQLEPQKRVQNEKKKQNRHPELRNHTKDPPIAPLFFRHYATFLKLFGLHQRPPFICFDILQQWMSKNPKGSPLLHFSAL